MTYTCEICEADLKSKTEFKEHLIEEQESIQDEIDTLEVQLDYIDSELYHLKPKTGKSVKVTRKTYKLTEI